MKTSVIPYDETTTEWDDQGRWLEGGRMRRRSEFNQLIKMSDKGRAQDAVKIVFDKGVK